MRLVRGFVVLLLASGCAVASPSLPGSPSPSPSPSPTSAASVSASSTAASRGPATPTASPSPDVLTSDPLHALVLVDVRNGQTLTLGRLAAEKPLLVETMAIWCTNCRSQMHQVTAAHRGADFHSVSIDVEPYEAPEDLAAYAAAEGFDWAFAKADAAIASALRERFGTAVLNPPGMPKLLFLPDGSVELLPLNDELSAAELVTLVGG